MKKNKIILILSFISLVFSSVISAGFTFADYAPNYSYSASSNFEYTGTGDYEGTRLHCYDVEGEPTLYAIAWGTDNPSDSPDNLVIPKTINGKTVAILSKSAFRFCDFETISLPNSIKEMQQEAFYCCNNLTKITIPYYVTAIAPSTFMGCRNLATVNYRSTSEDNAIESTENTNITIIGDHAFTSCVKIKYFDFPTNLSEIGHSAFQNCKSLLNVIFPKAQSLVIGDYAFADCSSLGLGYFSTNLSGVGDHAFAKCEKLALYYTGSSVPEGEGFGSLWRKKHTASNKTDEKSDYVPINLDQGEVREDKVNHPGLYYSIQNTAIYYDGKRPEVTNDQSIFIFPKGEYYAKIIRFVPPEENTDDYDVNTKALTIPSTLNDENGNPRKVRVIGNHAFEALTEVKNVVFNENLIQICHEAFLECSDIETLNFEACKTSLLEVSYNVFCNRTNNGPTTENSKLTSLKLPQSLKYVGSGAFCNFTKVQEFDLKVDGNSNAPLEVIGQYAFENLGKNVSETYYGTVDLTLRNTLSDSRSAPNPGTDSNGGFSVKRACTYVYAGEEGNAVKTGAFKNCPLLKNVTMEPVSDGTLLACSNNDGSPKAHAVLKPRRMSFGPSVFEGCANMERFTSNHLLYMIGKDCFKGCVSLKEMFLSSFGSETTTYTGTPWGAKQNQANTGFGGSIFGESKINNCVIYVDRPKIDYLNNNARDNKWNSCGSFPNYHSQNWELKESTVPTYYNTKWIDDDGIKPKYIVDFDPTDETATNVENVFPSNKASIAVLETKTNEYTVTKCYPYDDTDIANVDLTGIGLNEGSGSIVSIGKGAFAHTSGIGPVPGTRFYLPDSIQTISERAFHRHSDGSENSNGVELLTYEDAQNSGNVFSGSGVSISKEDLYTSGSKFCCLPASTTRVERLAFFNNRFTTIRLSSSLSFLGNTAFTACQGGEGEELNSRNTISSFETNGNAVFSKGTSDTDGLYYSNTLLYHVPDSTKMATLNLESGTVSVASRALANSDYKKIVLNTSLTTVYGGSFINNLELEEIDTSSASSLKYIAATPASPDVDPYDEEHYDLFDGSLYYQNTGKAKDPAVSGSAPGDIEFSNTFGAFAKCPNLTKFDFTNLNASLKKIGYGAFYNDAKLDSMVPATTPYKYYKWDTTMAAGETETSNLTLFASPADNKGVLDLSGCENLISIGKDAFENCSLIKYVHLPNNPNLYLTRDQDNGASALADDNIFDNTSVTKAKKGIVLVGETAKVANKTYGDNYDSTKDRYPAKALPSDCTYYQVTKKADIATKAGANQLKYWYDLGNKNFLLFDNQTLANDYFGL